MNRDLRVHEYTTTGDYEMPVTLDYLYADATAGAITVTLKRTHDKLFRRQVVVKIDSSANAVTVTDGTLSVDLVTQDDAGVFEQKGTGQFFMSSANLAGAALQIAAGQSLTYSSTEYADDGSFQPIGPDLNLDPAAGTSDVGDSSYLAPIMGNVIGDLLTKTHNIIAGLIGKFSVTGARASTYPLGGVVGEISDGVTEADGAVIAVLGGDSAQTNARAAFSVDNQNSTPGSGFDYGLDLLGVDHDGYGPVEYLEADIRFADGTTQSTAGGDALEIPTGDIDGVNDEYVFVGTPKAVFLNGVLQQPTVEVVIAGNTATFVTPPPVTQGAWVGGFVS